MSHLEYQTVKYNTEYSNTTPNINITTPPIQHQIVKYNTKYKHHNTPNTTPNSQIPAVTPNTNIVSD
jgi:hypothetical protein